MAARAHRKGSVTRKTKETEITVGVDIDGDGAASVTTGIGFFDHMLDLFARHGLIDLVVKAKGDLDVDAHHTVEDVGIALGQALLEALGDKRGITRIAGAAVPMDESLARVTLDISGRPFLRFDAQFTAEKIGAFDSELTEDFLRALSVHAGLNLHVTVPYGGNSHHICEAVFKALARALRAAVAIDPREKGVPSTKGTL